ncbi:MAG: hypothetical protein ABEI99_04085 [Halobaculum sp.]
MILLQGSGGSPVGLEILLGFLGGVVTSFGVVFVRRWLRRRGLRQALLAELRLPGATIRRARNREMDDVSEPVHTQIPMTVYEGRTGSLGLLGRDELEALIRYYEVAKVAREQLESLDDEEVAERFFDETVEKLDEQRRAAIRELGGDVSSSADRETHGSDGTG